MPIDPYAAVNAMLRAEVCRLEPEELREQGEPEKGSGPPAREAAVPERAVKGRGPEHDG
ncbi:hypothetical protein [Streptomyces sp. GC420]|uniref:hypothetical protein n=1 Tax=Streptomyces sp. GC420 TaxID=2697568 RepID=UPI001414E932|nr:hypothetical protein [Streptomyces sp. GC420]NBM15742.1 hypothetical protein [Streptomyces sp. GC420]